MSSPKKCKGCVHQWQSVCAKFHIPVDEEKDGCTWRIGKSQLSPCSLCKKMIPQPIITILEDHRAIGLCQQCYQMLGTCATCVTGGQGPCAFQKETTMPDYVKKQVQVQGGFVVTSVKNPDKVAITCANGCPCYDKESDECIRSSGIACGAYKINL